MGPNNLGVRTVIILRIIIIRVSVGSRRAADVTRRVFLPSSTGPGRGRGGKGEAQVTSVAIITITLCA